MVNPLHIADSDAALAIGMESAVLGVSDLTSASTYTNTETSYTDADIRVRWPDDVLNGEG